MQLRVSDLTEVRIRFLALAQSRGEIFATDFEDALNRGSTATAYMLLRMYEDGFFSRTEVKGRGRPRYAYRITDAGSLALKEARAEIGLTIDRLKELMS